jgi:hypothetical protein
MGGLRPPISPSFEIPHILPSWVGVHVNDHLVIKYIREKHGRLNISQNRLLPLNKWYSGKELIFKYNPNIRTYIWVVFQMITNFSGNYFSLNDQIFSEKKHGR